MEEEIKSTLEIALAKAEKIGKASKEELEWEKYKEEGLLLVGKFLKGEVENLRESLQNLLKGIPENFRSKVIKVIMESLLKNLTLPREEYHLKESKRILQGIKALLIKVPQIDKLFSELEKMLNDYYVQKEALYKELVKRFSLNLAQLEKAVSEQLGAKVKLSPEAHPQFQEEWQKLKEHLDREYEKQLEYFKHLLLKMIP